MIAMTDLSMVTLKMVISLAVVLAIIWGLYRAAKKNLPMVQNSGHGKLMRVLENQYLGIKKTITMVQIPGAILVLGISSDKVNLLTQIDDPTTINGIKSRMDNPRSILSFRDQLQRLTRSKRSRLHAEHGEKAAER
jgi:flagellar protein FliO/FliZ